MGAVEGEHPGEDVGGRKGASGRAGVRSSPRHPSKAAMTTSIWASILHPSMRLTMPRRQLREHRRPRRCHPRPIPTSVPTAHPRSEISPCIPHSRYGGSRINDPFSSPTFTSPTMTMTTPGRPSPLHPSPSIDRTTTVGPHTRLTPPTILAAVDDIPALIPKNFRFPRLCAALVC